MTRKLLPMLFALCTLPGCAVDYGLVRWLYVDQSLDAEWYAVIDRASQRWGDAVGQRIRLTRDPHATPHTIRQMVPSECEHTLASPGTYLINDVSVANCVGLANFNHSTGTWTVGLVIGAFENQSALTYYDRLQLATHELGHVLGCEHVDEPAATMFPMLHSRSTLDSIRLRTEDLTAYFDAQDGGPD